MGKNKPARAGRLLPIVLIAFAALALGGAAIITLRPPVRASGGAAAPAKAAPVVATPPGVPAEATGARAPQRVPVTDQDGVVRLDAASLADGVARFFAYRAGGKTIPFFVLQGRDGVLRAAFDACDVCYRARKGYHQEGDVMVCNNCGNRFPSVRINVETGGCNPAPLKAEVRGDSVIIRVEDLQAGSRYF